MRPSLVFTSGLTSTRRASSATKVFAQGHHGLGDTLGHVGRELRLGHDLAGLDDVDAGVGVDRDLREGLGVFSATSSMSMPPCTEAMARKVRLVRSRRYET
ncbi:hypothetical protein SBADM41S_03221 [Streptomyces badius]